MRPWLLVAGAVYAAVGATFTSHSIPALVAVLVPGVAALVAVAVLRGRRVPAAATANTGHRAWVIWAGCFTAWELLALFLGELSFSLLMDPVLEIYPLRVAGWALWLSAGWLLVRR